MQLRTTKQWELFKSLQAQFEDESAGIPDDPDFYEPKLTPAGAVYCVRPALARSPARRALGLSPLGNHPKRYGLDGASKQTRGFIKLLARCMDQFQGRCAFGAFTPSPDDFFAIEEAEGGAAKFQWQLGKALSEMYVKRGKDACWLLVPELTPKLSKTHGRPLVHWHVLAVNKRSKWEPGFWLSLEDWRWVYETAYRRHVGREPLDVRATVSLRIAKSPSRYLGKYLSKNPSGLGGVDFSAHEDAVPKQWQSASEPAKRLVKELTLRLPSAFADFLWREWQVLEGMELGYFHTFLINERTGWEVGSFRFKSVEALALCWERFVSQARTADPADVGQAVPPGVVPAREEEHDFSVGVGVVRALEAALQPVHEQLCLGAI